MPVASKYERPYGNAPEVMNIRDGASFELVFGRVQAHAVNKAADRLSLLRWAVLRLLIGNGDAHGKNLSFFMEHAGVRLAPAYDLVSVMAYGKLDHELAMAFGDVFALEGITAFALADFSLRCRLDRKLVAREIRKLCVAASDVAPSLADDPQLIEEERRWVSRLAQLVTQQAARLAAIASDIPKVSAAAL